ncbi:unnamed protein product [Oppiella nova]|uniref:STAS domain-containing protein n=1 Tax=Oppiella nova TaxID=334625 RepID=A0A7R9MFN9_9ACAR|nr:unnamed protein product [Oppiella nova]CAG2176528.1 unnamed protein product [Oppiella nova]
MELRKEPYNVKIVGEIGNNFPTPMSPNWKLFPIMWDKCIATAIVGYTITLSVGKIYGKKHGYKVDPNQEMIAMGAANMISSTFQCIPCAASLPRSALQETAGGKTQVVSVVNCLCIVVVILALGRYLEELPTCVLGSCIAVALVSLITKVGEFRRFWKVSKLDGMIWMITFVFVLVLCVDYGIYIGIVASLLLLIYKSERPKTYLLGTMPELDIYVPINKFNRVEEPKDFKIFQMCGPLNFSNVEYFSTELENKCGFHLTSIQKYMKSKEYKSSYAKVSQNIRYETLPKIQLTRLALNYDTLPKYLVIDCSVFSFIDFSGISTLKKIILTFEDIGIQTVLSGIHVHLESMLAKEGFFTDISTDHLYKTIHDAVVCLQELENESKEDDVFNENYVSRCLTKNL